MHAIRKDYENAEEEYFQGQKQVALGKGLLLASVRDLNEIALTLVANESEEET